MNQSLKENQRLNQAELERIARSVHHSTLKLSQLWAEIRDDARKTGKQIATADAWIAATALFYKVPLITNNASDFQAVSGLTIISES